MPIRITEIDATPAAFPIISSFDDHPTRSKMRFPAIDANAVRKEFGLTPKTPLVACAARLFRGKGQDLAIRALPLVRKALPDVKLMIVGQDDRLATPTSFSAESMKSCPPPI